MTKRAISGKNTIMGAHEAALQPANPLFSVYNLVTTTKYAENARETEENGPYGQFFAISTPFFRSTNLTGWKTAKNSNKGLLGTTHNLSLCTPLRTLLSYRVQPVGRPQSPDVRREII